MCEDIHFWKRDLEIWKLLYLHHCGLRKIDCHHMCLCYIISSTCQQLCFLPAWAWFRAILLFVPLSNLPVLNLVESVCRWAQACTPFPTHMVDNKILDSPCFTSIKWFTQNDQLEVALAKPTSGLIAPKFVPRRGFALLGFSLYLLRALISPCGVIIVTPIFFEFTFEGSWALFWFSQLAYVEFGLLSDFPFYVLDLCFLNFVPRTIQCFLSRWRYFRKETQLLSVHYCLYK